MTNKASTRYLRHSTLLLHINFSKNKIFKEAPKMFQNEMRRSMLLNLWQTKHLQAYLRHSTPLLETDFKKS